MSEAPRDKPALGHEPTLPASGQTPGTPPIEQQPPSFADGEILGGRYRVDRFVARGGMGEVYVATDLELDTRVALKTIAREIASDGRTVERFKREILLARRVTHPNVCRIFDVGFHSPTGDADASLPTPFLTMELLLGETLARRITRAGRMKPADAEPLAVQIAEGLAAAHRAGVIHGDFKPHNVILVDEDGGTRAVVTDFGLARPAQADDPLINSMSRGDFIGTPTFMAPEQLEGGGATVASDIYALGLVLYEMVTGQRAFSAATPLAGVLARLKADSPSPRAIVPDVTPRWNRVIRRCLAREPGDRYATPSDVARALRGDESFALPRRTRRRLGALAIGAAGLVVVAVLGVRAMRHAQSPAPATAVSAPTAAAPTAPATAHRKSIAVMGFRDLGGRADTAWLSTALSEMVTTEIASGGALRTIPGETVARTKLELGLGADESYAPATLGRLHDNLGVDQVVSGSYLVLAGDGDDARLRLDLRLQSVDAADAVEAIAEEGTVRDLFDLVSRAGLRLRERLGVRPVAATELAGVRAALPRDTRAARAFAEGLERYRHYDPVGAQERLAAAIAIEPGHAQAHSALGMVWSALGYDGRAVAEAQAALDHATGLGREEQLLIAARYHQAKHDFPKAIEAYQALYGFFPDNVEYGLSLAVSQHAAGRYPDAEATLTSLRGLPPPAGDDPRIELVDAQLGGSRGDVKRELAGARRVVQRARQMGRTFLAAQARIVEGRALTDLGQMDDAVTALEDARKTFEQLGDRANVAQATNSLAVVRQNRGDLDGAEKQYREVLTIAKSIGDRRAEVMALNNLAVLAEMHGHHADAAHAQEEALVVRREIGDRPGEARALNNLGNAVLHRGQLGDARKHFEAALAIHRELGNKRGEAMVLGNLSTVAREGGDFSEATRRAEEALAIQKAMGNKSGMAYAMDDVAAVLVDQHKLGDARKRLEEVLALREQLGEKATIAASRETLAELDLEEGHARQAEGPLRQAVDELAKEAIPDDEADARVKLGEALVLLHREDEARAESEKASALAAKSE